VDQNSTLESERKSAEEELASWGRQYVEALAELANRLGISPLELHHRMRNEIREISETPVTPDCLTLAEFDLWRAQTLPPPRHDHLVQCRFCTEVADALSSRDPQGESAFVARALQAGGESKRPLRVGVAVGASLVGLGAAVWSIHRAHAANADKEKKETHEP
jgi:hypothetical protein